MINLRFVVDFNIIIDHIFQRSEWEKVSIIIDFLLKKKMGFISSSSIPTIFFLVQKHKPYFLKHLPKFLNKFNIAKTPSYIDFNEKLAKEDIEKYLLELSARSIKGYILTRDKKFLESSSIAISPNEFFDLIEEKENNRNISFTDLPLQVFEIFSNIEKSWDEITACAQFICGKYVKEFEEKFARYLDAKFCIGVNSGTSALIVALMSIGLEPGDEVIMPVNTFIATAEAVSILGGKPVFVDIHPEFFTINVDQIENKITKKTKVIIPVHLYGQCADLDPILKIAKKYNLFVIEDACQAHGAEYRGKKAGTIGDIGCFSFYPSKNLGAWGEGGACVTNNEELAEKMIKIRNHGGMVKFQHDILGGNFRMEEFQAAVLSTKLKFIDDWNNLRRDIAKNYNMLLKDIGNIELPKEADYNSHVYHLYVIKTAHRDRLKEYLDKNGIGNGIHYPLPLNLHPFFRNTNKNNNFFVAKDISKKILSLPIYPFLTVEEIEFISTKIKDYFENN